MAMADPFSLAGRTAVVTGGSTGIGFAMSRALLARGARVMIVGRRQGLLNEAVAALAAERPGAEVTAHAADLYDRADVDALATAALDRFGRVDILVGNAGAVHEEMVVRHESFDACMQLNLNANIALVQAFTPGMKANRWGRLLFSSSTASHLAAPNRGNYVYAASKSGLNAYARVIASDLGPYGVTVNCIVFGVFWTSIVEEAVGALRAAQGDAAVDALIGGFTDMTALRRLGRIEDAEGLVQLLASDAGGYITGASIPLDGGTSIMMRAHETPMPA